MLDRVEGNDLLEEVKHAVTQFSVREIRHRGRSRPRDDGHQQDSYNDGAFHPIKHQQSCQDSTTEYPDPHGRIAHLCVRRTEAGRRIAETIHTACQFNRRVRGACYQPDSRTVGQSNQRKIQPNARSGCQLDRRRQRAGQPLADPQ